MRSTSLAGWLASILLGSLYLYLVEIHGGYASMAPPWVNAISGIGIAVCVLTLVSFSLDWAEIGPNLPEGDR
jgi:hypothetical protein